MTMVAQLNKKMAPGPRQVAGQTRLPMVKLRAGDMPTVLLYNYTTTLLTDTN
jgi:hypothetical protein